MNDVPDPIVEGLIVPIYDDDHQPLATAWIVSHDEADCHFSLDTVRIVNQLSIQVALGLKLSSHRQR